MAASDKDRAILRSLAHRAAGIAALPIQAELTRLWMDFDSLRPHRPMVITDPQGGWPELAP